MTPAQKTAAVAALTARIVTLEASQPIPAQAAIARSWLARRNNLDAFWGAAAMLVRGERVAATRVRRVGIIADITDVLEETRVAVGATVGDADLRDPNTR